MINTNALLVSLNMREVETSREKPATLETMKLKTICFVVLMTGGLVALTGCQSDSTSSTSQASSVPSVSRPDIVLSTNQPVPVPPQGFDLVRQETEKGKVERVEYDAPAVAADLKRWMEIYTPPGYSKSKKYPVFYLIHGAGQNERAWVDSGHANVVLDNLIADKKIVPMIVVFPNGDATVPGAGGGARGAVGAPNGPGAGDAGLANPGGGGGRGAGARGGRGGGGSGGGMNFTAFENDLLKDLIPYVESHYSTYTDSKHRALAGLSLGGMQTRTIAPAHADKFAYAGVFSGGNILPENITDMGAFKKNVKLVYMSFGSRESSAPRGGGTAPSGPEGIKLAADALNKAGVKADYYVSPNSAHDFTSWKRSLFFFSQMLFRD